MTVYINYQAAQGCFTFCCTKRASNALRQCQLMFSELSFGVNVDEDPDSC